MIVEIGKHRVRHGNIYEQEEVAAFVGDDKADIFYSDPPWGSGNLRYWDTINKKMNDGAADYDFGFEVDRFLDVVLDSAVRFTDGWVVIEHGKRWTAMLIEKAIAKGLHYCGEVEALYNSGGKKHPLDIVVFHTAEPKALDLSPAYHTSGYHTVKTLFGILNAEGATTGMDLCCGMGYTARPASTTDSGSSGMS